MSHAETPWDSQHVHLSLEIADYGYVLEDGAIVLKVPADSGHSPMTIPFEDQHFSLAPIIPHRCKVRHHRVEASRTIRQAEVGAAQTMINRTEERFGLKLEQLAADTAYGSAATLNWLVQQESPRISRSWTNRSGKTAASRGNNERDIYTCPAGNILSTTRRVVNVEQFLYRASKLDCADRRVLGSDVAINIEVIDETNTRINVPTLLARFWRHSDFGLVALVGVQSNQYPRALDIARPFREAGVPVASGAFHVSGCLSMLDGHAVDLDACRDMGVAIFAGEAEGVGHGVA